MARYSRLSSPRRRRGGPKWCGDPVPGLLICSYGRAGARLFPPPMTDFASTTISLMAVARLDLSGISLQPKISNSPRKGLRHTGVWGMSMDGVYVLLTFGVGLVVGFGGGYGVREIISRRRRTLERSRQMRHDSISVLGMLVGRKCGVVQRYTSNQL